MLRNNQEVYINNQKLTEQQRNLYLKKIIEEAFNLFKDNESNKLRKGTFLNFIRYLGRFPSDAQAVQIIFPKLFPKEEDTEIEYDKLEEIVLEILKTNEYLPDSCSKLLDYFKTIDIDNNGYINIDYLKMLMVGSKNNFPEEDFNKMIEFSQDKNNIELGNFYYEDYIYKLSNSIDKHTSNIYNYKRFVN